MRGVLRGEHTKRRLRLYGWADAAGQDILSQVGVRSFGRAWGEYQVAGAFGRGKQKAQADRVGVTLDSGRRCVGTGEGGGTRYQAGGVRRWRHVGFIVGRGLGGVGWAGAEGWCGKTNSSTGFFPIQGNCKSEKGEKRRENTFVDLFSLSFSPFRFLRLPYRSRKPVEEFVFCHTSPLLQPNPRLSLNENLG